MTTTAFAILIPAAYLVGSIPSGLLVGKAKGIDVRTAGSGNIGATNVGRLLGRKFFFLVFFLDLLKSFLPMLVASMLVPALRDWVIYLLWLSVGFAAVLGHMFSIYLRFRGGKGVSTSAGMMLGLFPYYTVPGMIAAAVFMAVFFPTRYVSLASMAGACAFPVLYVAIGLVERWPIFGAQLPLLVVAVLIAAMIVLRHRGNISRLRAGTESRFGG